MTKKILLSLLLFINYNGFSQETVNSFPIELKTNRDVFQVVNDSTKQTAFFISDRKKVTKYILDEKMEIIDSISSFRPDTKYKDILGFSKTKSVQTIYWSNKNKEKICAQSFNLQKRKVIITEYEIKVDSNPEKYIQVFSENNKFYILTLIRDSNSLKLYEFNGNIFKEVNIDLSIFKLYKSNNETASIFKIFEKSIGDSNVFEESYKLPRITSESPTSLTESTKKTKCYSNSEEIIITLDLSDLVTQIITINLKTFDAKLNNIEKPSLTSISIDNVKSNSFIIEGKLLQLTLCENKMNLSLKDFNGTIIKEYIINENDKFKINNSGFIRQNYMGSERELETTSQFLRKIVRSNVGVSAYNLNGNYLLTLGSVSPERSYNGGGIGAMGGLAGMNNMQIAEGLKEANFFQPINFVNINFYYYGTRRSISTDCLFDYNLNHIDIKLQPLAFDKIAEFKKKYTQIETETVFVVNKIYYFGYFSTLLKKYVFKKFTD